MEGQKNVTPMSIYGFEKNTQHIFFKRRTFKDTLCSVYTQRSRGKRIGIYIITLLLYSTSYVTQLVQYMYIIYDDRLLEYYGPGFCWLEGGFRRPFIF